MSGISLDSSAGFNVRVCVRVRKDLSGIFLQLAQSLTKRLLFHVGFKRRSWPFLCEMYENDYMPFMNPLKLTKRTTSTTTDHFKALICKATCLHLPFYFASAANSARELRVA